MNEKVGMKLEKAIMINGSPHAERGITFKILQVLKEGMTSSGCEVEIVNLAKKNIRQCKGCLYCWHDNVGMCFFKDDMERLISQMLKADIIILATPIYFNNITTDMKLFLERLMPLQRKDFCLGEDGIYHHVCGKKVPKLAIVSTCGLPDYSNFKIISEYMKLLAENWNTEVVAEIYRTEAYIFEYKYDFLRILLSEYKTLLKNAGTELATIGRLTDKTTRRLARNLVPRDVYVDTGKTYQFGRRWINE